MHTSASACAPAHRCPRAPPFFFCKKGEGPLRRGHCPPVFSLAWRTRVMSHSSVAHTSAPNGSPAPAVWILAIACTMRHAPCTCNTPALLAFTCTAGPGQVLRAMVWPLQAARTYVGRASRRLCHIKLHHGKSSRAARLRRPFSPAWHAFVPLWFCVLLWFGDCAAGNEKLLQQPSCSHAHTRTMTRSGATATPHQPPRRAHAMLAI